MRHSATTPAKPAHDLMLWYAVLSGPVVWSGHLLFSYLLVSTCGGGETAMRLILGAMTVAAELLIISGGVAGYARWQPRGARLGSDDRDEGRASFMGYLAVLESILFVVATLFTVAPVYVLRVCA